LVDERREHLRDFLISRRARVTPEQAGVISHGARRVPGLRRSELAMLAGVSVEYLTKLERGNARGVSDSVLSAVAEALRLDDAETAHLFELARGAQAGSGPRRRPAQQRVRPGVQQLLDAVDGVPAMVQNGRLDIVATNALARALYCDVYENLSLASGSKAPNFARYIFLDDRATEFYPDWERAAADCVYQLRAEAGRTPADRPLNELIGELSTRSRQFSALWAAHNVKWHTTGIKRFRHRVVGELTLAYEGLTLVGDPGQTLFIYTAEPGSTSAEALSFLASWAHTPAAASTSADRGTQENSTAG
jgi:transcriptional regulator with XRE-family HTH domain